MRKAVPLIVAMSLLLALAGCSRSLDLGNGPTRKHYPAYGLFDEDTKRSKNVCYELSIGNVIWGIILIETVIFPVYFIGWSLYNPVRLKKGPGDECTFDS